MTMTTITSRVSKEYYPQCVDSCRGHIAFGYRTFIDVPFPKKALCWRYREVITYNFTGKTAIVTGAASGLGAAITGHLCASGARTYGFDLNRRPIQDRMREHSPAAATFLQVDVTDPEAVRASINDVLRQSGRLDYLVNAAGIYPNVPLATMRLEDWRCVLDVNLTSVFLLTQQFAKVTIPGGKRSIVNIATIAAEHPDLLLTHYSASKAGVVGFTRASAASLGNAGIRVNAVSPGLIDSPMVRRDARDRLMRYKKRAVLQRVPQYRDLVPAVLFLLSDSANCITGQNLTIDAGVTLANVY